MARIYVHTPLNISRTLVKMLEEFCKELKGRHGLEINIETQPHNPSEESKFSSYIKKSELPDLSIGHVNDFADLPKQYLAEHLLALPDRFPVRNELPNWVSGIAMPSSTRLSLFHSPCSIIRSC